MNIPVNIKEIIATVNMEDIIILLPGVILFAFWLLHTSYGRKALENSLPRRNDMPVLQPLVLFFVIFLAIGLGDSLILDLTKNLENQLQVFISESVKCILALASIAIILCYVKKHFVRGIKGFGLNIKTIPKDFVMAFINLFAVYPLIYFVFLATTIINELIYGPNYQIPTHVELQTMEQNTSLLIRITITISVVVVTPFLEEMLFRGLFQTTIRSILNMKYSAWIAIFATSLFFVVNHANPSHWPILFILSACMGYSYEKSGSLFRSIFIHAIFNGSAIISIWHS